MQLLARPQADSIISKFPELRALGNEYEEEDVGVPDIYKRYEISVVKDGFEDDDCEKMEILNISKRLADLFKLVANTVDRTFADNIEEWDKNLLSFCKNLWLGRTIYATVYDIDTIIDEPEEIYEVIYSFDSEGDFLQTCKKDLDNLYEDADEDDWPQSFWNSMTDDFSDFDSAMVGKGMSLILLIPESGCVLCFDRDKSIVVYILNTHAESLATLKELVSRSNLFIREQNEWGDE